MAPAEPLSALYAEVAEDQHKLQLLEQQRELHQTGEQEARRQLQEAEATCTQIAAEVQQAEHAVRAMEESIHDIEGIHLLTQKNPLLENKETIEGNTSPRLRANGQPDMRFTRNQGGAAASGITGKDAEIDSLISSIDDDTAQDGLQDAAPPASSKQEELLVTAQPATSVDGTATDGLAATVNSGTSPDQQRAQQYRHQHDHNLAELQELQERLGHANQHLEGIQQDFIAAASLFAVTVRRCRFITSKIARMEAVITEYETNYLDTIVAPSPSVILYNGTQVDWSRKRQATVVTSSPQPLAPQALFATPSSSSVPPQPAVSPILGGSVSPPALTSTLSNTIVLENDEGDYKIELENGKVPRYTTPGALPVFTGSVTTYAADRQFFIVARNMLQVCGLWMAVQIGLPAYMWQLTAACYAALATAAVGHQANQLVDKYRPGNSHGDPKALWKAFEQLSDPTQSQPLLVQELKDILRESKLVPTGNPYQDLEQFAAAISAQTKLINDVSGEMRWSLSESDITRLYRKNIPKEINQPGITMLIDFSASTKCMQQMMHLAAEYNATHGISLATALLATDTRFD